VIVALVKEHFEHLKVEKEKEGVKGELSKLKQQYDLAQQFIQNQVQDGSICARMSPLMCATLKASRGAQAAPYYY
jgi:hypothetical protein